MTAPALSRLLISHITLRGPELRQLYDLIVGHQSINYDQIAETLTPSPSEAPTFGLEEAPLREALNFLLVAGLVRQQGASRRRASFYATPLLEDAPFSLLLLHHIHTHRDERQRAPSLIYRQLVAADALSVTLQGLRDQMERGPYRQLFAWTGEKITLWSHLATYLGLAWRLDREGVILIVPQLDLTRSALRWATSIT